MFKSTSISLIYYFVRDTVSESLSDILQNSQTPVQALWNQRSIDLRFITLHPSFVKVNLPRSAWLVQLTSEPIRDNVFSFVIVILLIFLVIDYSSCGRGYFYTDEIDALLKISGYVWLRLELPQFECLE